MNGWILISALIVATLVVIGLKLTLFVFKKKKEGKMEESNYQTFYIIGMAWVPIGVIFMITINLVIGIAFMSMGITYLAISLANLDKWEKKEE